MPIQHNGSAKVAVVHNDSLMYKVVHKTGGVEKTVWESDFNYNLLDNGTYSVFSNPAIKLSGDVVIPGEVNKRAITEIAEDGFLNQTDKPVGTITSLTIGENVTTINNYGCACRGLTTIKIPASLRYVGSQGFQLDGTFANLHVADIASWCNIEYEDIHILSSSRHPNLYVNDELITDLVIPDSVTAIKANTFQGIKSITSVTIGSNVASIGGSSFAYCSNLASVTLSDSVKTIEGAAFSDCGKFSSIIIPETVEVIKNFAFQRSPNLKIYCKATSKPSGWESSWSYGTKAAYYYSANMPSDLGYWRYVDGVPTTWDNEICLTYTLQSDDTYSVRAKSTSTPGEIIIPSTYNGKPVTAIDENGFKNCTKMTSVTIPASITYFGDGAFYNCTGLTGVYIFDIAAWCVISNFSCGMSHPLWWAKNLYLNGELVTNLTIPSGITHISYAAFCSCESLVSVIMPDTVISMGDGAFYECINLSSITFSNNLGEISYESFYGCTSLTDINLSDSITTIGDSAFIGCTSLTGITIPDSVTTIGDDVFDGCDHLESVTFGENNRLTTIGGYAFANTAITNIEIPSSVTSIGGSAFYGCTGLTNIIIPRLITVIEDGLFEDCTNLQSIDVMGEIESIGVSAFRNCTSLTNINGLYAYSIGKYAFYNCSSLPSITIWEETETIGKQAFYNCSNLIIYCETTEQPSGWDADWNSSNCPVYWYSETKPTELKKCWRYVNGVPTVWDAQALLVTVYTVTDYSGSAMGEEVSSLRVTPTFDKTIIPDETLTYKLSANSVTKFDGTVSRVQLSASCSTNNATVTCVGTGWIYDLTITADDSLTGPVRIIISGSVDGSIIK